MDVEIYFDGVHRIQYTHENEFNSLIFLAKRTTVRFGFRRIMRMPLFGRRSVTALVLVSLISAFSMTVNAQRADLDSKSRAGVFAVQRGPSRAAAVSKAAHESLAPANDFEIRLVPETDAWFISGGVRFEERTGKPAAIYNAAFRTSEGSPELRAREYLNANAQFLGLAATDIASLRLHHIRVFAEGDTVVRLRQTYKNLPVNKNAEITIHIDHKGVVDFVQNGFVYGIELKDATPAISIETARSLVANRMATGTAVVNHESTELMIHHYQGASRLVYRINQEFNAPAGDWESYVDAETGEIVKLEDVASYHKSTRSKNIGNSDGAILATGTGNVFDPDPLSTAGATYGGGYVDGTDANAAVLTAQLKSVTLPDITLSAGTYSLTGPYAVIADFEFPNKGLFTQASSTFAFDRNADNFEAVMCYYHIDTAMRYLNVTLALPVTPYQYGGGVQVDPSGLNGADNSHYVGSTGRLAFGEGGVDDAEDADVIWHELGHGLHDWFTAGGLSQVNGLSEGIGDYWAASYSRFKGGWTSAQTAYNWTFNWDGHNPFWGGRIVNYTGVYPTNLTGAIHTDGQIWATSNMKIWDAIGRQKADKAFWKGIALTNGSTNQNDAANAVMTASGTLGYSFVERTAMRNQYTATGYNVLVPTAANVSVSGRVTNAFGNALSNVRVTISNGTVSRTATTNNFGYYRFDEIASGETYIVNVKSRRYQFTNGTRVISVNDNIADIDFSSDE